MREYYPDELKHYKYVKKVSLGNGKFRYYYEDDMGVEYTKDGNTANGVYTDASGKRELHVSQGSNWTDRSATIKRSNGTSVTYVKEGRFSRESVTAMTKLYNKVSSASNRFKSGAKKGRVYVDNLLSKIKKRT